MADRPIPNRASLQVVLIQPAGMGWRIGIGPVVSGTIERAGAAFVREREAERAARELADAHDLILLRA